jgi:sialate O-acetylesterase
MKKVSFILCAALLQFTAATAQVKLCAVFSDNMVMQQQREKAPVWGESKPGKTVKVTTSWDNATYTTTADNAGKWSTAVKTPSAGGPYTITITDGSKKKTVLKNVMIGEVWVCSGQSNMEMPVEGWGHVKDWEKEKAEAGNYPNIRLLLATKVTGGKPMSDLAVEHGGWQVCNAESVADFSACAYFFGRDLNKYRGVPVGLIDTSWGGTIIEAWMSADAFKGIPDQEENMKKIENLPASEADRAQLYKVQYDEWLEKVNETDKGYKDGKPWYATTAVDDSSWKTFHLPGTGSEVGTINAFWWVRKVIDIPQKWAGKELKLNLGQVDDNDVTYFNGEMIGSTIGCMAGRTYTIPARLVKAGKAVVAVRIHDTGGLSGINCGDDDFCIALKNGSDKISLVGDWRYEPSMNEAKVPVMPVNTGSDPNVHTFLYNSMINPIVPFAIKGAIWYQGEANVSQSYQYRELMPLMIKDWRNKWGYDFPFYMVQLANFMQRQDKPQESTWAELREAQLMTRLHLDNVGMATIIDIGEANDIHPKNKQEVGHRLALAARATAYGEKIDYEGPVYRGYKTKGNTVVVNFQRNTAKGLRTSDNGKVKGFAVAGADHVWHWADAKIEGNTVVVSSSEVAFPLAVRYAWADNPECNLVNGAGLPASPFRTDDWPGMSFGNKR